MIRITVDDKHISTRESIPLRTATSVHTNRDIKLSEVEGSALRYCMNEENVTEANIG